MQKRGFPAAGILALLVLVTILLIIAGKLINRRLKMLAGRKNNSIRRSIATITTYRSRQPSPSTVISFPNTPLIPPMNLRKDVVTPNTMVELISVKSQEYVVDIHRRNNEDELSVFLLEKTTQINPETQQIADIDDGDGEEEVEERKGEPDLSWLVFCCCSFSIQVTVMYMCASGTDIDREGAFHHVLCRTFIEILFLLFPKAIDNICSCYNKWKHSVALTNPFVDTRDTNVH